MFFTSHMFLEYKMPFSVACRSVKKSSSVAFGLQGVKHLFHLPYSTLTLINITDNTYGI
uniref:Uncharacterized protein n=1 Tax=Arion vulgaris TaxID=1028688 RepID=A0A0B7AJW0_9EUPU